MPNERPFEVSKELFNAAENENFFLDMECALGLFAWPKKSDQQVMQPSKLNN